MFDSPKKKSLFSFFIISLVLITLNFNNYGQCGVYSKHTKTQLFPHGKVHLDRSEDMTGDGIPDVIASGELTSDRRDKIFIIPNNGDGTFGAPIIINIAAETPIYYTYMLGHINNDAFMDIVTIFEFSTNAVQVYLNNGDGTFTTQPIFNSPQIGRPQFLIDINNDGFGDYFGFTNGAQFRYSLGNGDGTFAPPVTLMSNIGGQPGDFNNDGLIDFINSRDLYINQGNGNFAITDITSITNNQNIGGISDYNGDGRSDFLLGTANGFAVLLKTDSSFSRTDYVVSTEPLAGRYSFIGNFSGDSSPDILYELQYLYKKVVFTNDGSGNFTGQEYAHHFYELSSYHKYLLNDFDNDGKTDLIQATSGISNSTLMFKDKTSFAFLKNVCNRPGQPRIVDFDGSNTSDYSFWKPSTGDWSSLSYSKNRQNSRTETVNWGLGSHGDIPAPGDFDGDGITDRAVFRNSTGVWYIRRSSDSQWIVFQFGLPGDKPVAADYDGDTVSDIAVWRPSDGNWYIWLTGSQQFLALNFGLDGDKPVPADFDGDLKTDVAVYRPSTGVWYYLKSSDGNFAAVQWGDSADIPIPADFDGDGNADPAVYRSSANTFYVLKSYDNSFAGLAWGIPGDIPYAGDFDGDYVADLGVYRPSTKQWWPINILQYGAVFGADNSILTSTIPRIE